MSDAVYEERMFVISTLLFVFVLHLSVYLPITSNVTDAADEPLMKTCVKNPINNF